MKAQEATRQTLRRRSDEPKLQIGDTVLIKEGVVGVLLARFTPSGERHNEVHYIVELKPDDVWISNTGKQEIPKPEKHWASFPSGGFGHVRTQAGMPQEVPPQ